MPTLSEIPEAIGLEYKGHPTGWYQIGWTDDLKPGDVKPLKYFSTDLVLYRTMEGNAVLQSAFCPHMGAHLGHGGKVCDETIVCPYHGWAFNAEGRNTHVPSLGTRSTTNRTLEVWHLHESNGIIFAWYDALGREPLWDGPADRRGEEKFLPLFPNCIHQWHSQRYKPQYVAENTVDLDHVVTVHKNTVLPVQRSKLEVPPIVDEGPVLYVNRYSDRSPAQHASPVFAVFGSNTLLGPGVIMVDFPADPDRPWRKPCILYQCTTPVDEDHSDGFTNVLVTQDTAAEDGNGIIPVGTALKRVNEQIYQANVDFPIWNNMIWLNQPAYTPVEAPIFHRVRRWFKQFYNDPRNEGVAARLLEAQADPDTSHLEPSTVPA